MGKTIDDVLADAVDAGESVIVTVTNAAGKAVSLTLDAAELAAHDTERAAAALVRELRKALGGVKVSVRRASK